jgi:sulfate adenylyltransferase
MESEHSAGTEASGAPGFCVWLTGLSASGKTTTANAVAALLAGRGREVTLLDGDAMRSQRAPGLGFTRADRDLNVRTIGAAAAEVVRSGGAAVCAAISPYRTTRDECRGMMAPGRFFEVFVDTPLRVCQERDPKGLYARAARGELTQFTGIDDPYEPPLRPEITLDTVGRSLQENAGEIVRRLIEAGLMA